MRQKTRNDRYLAAVLAAVMGILLGHALSGGFYTDFKQGFLEAING